MRNNQRILIGDKVLTRKDLFNEKDKFRKERAKIPFAEKIKILLDLQKLAKRWGKRKDITVWKI